MKKYRFYITLFGLVSVVALTSLSLNQEFNATNAYSYDQTALWGVKLQEALNKNYGQYKNTKIIGKYYKVGIMGHHKAIEFGNDFHFKTVEVDKLTNNYSVGALTSLTLETKTVNSVTNTFSFEKKVKVGHSKMMKAAFSFNNIASVGTENDYTTSYTYTYGQTFSETVGTENTVSASFNMNNLLNGKGYFHVGRVDLVLAIKINASYTEEQQWGQWKALSDTKNLNYYVYYYIDDFIVYVYSDGTFGDKAIGEYKLNESFKTL